MRWPTRKLARSDGEVITHRFLDAHALLTWLNRDELIARPEAEVDAIADDAEALTQEQRAKEDARLRAEILRVEREEEAASSRRWPRARTSRAGETRIPVLELTDTVPGLDE